MGVGVWVGVTARVWDRGWVGSTCVPLIPPSEMLPSSGTCPAPGRSIRSRCQEDSLLLLLLLFSCFVLLLFPLFSLLLFYSIPSIYYLRPILRLSPFRNCEGSHVRHFSRRPPPPYYYGARLHFCRGFMIIVTGSGLTLDYRYITWYVRITK